MEDPCIEGLPLFFISIISQRWKILLITQKKDLKN